MGTKKAVKSKDYSKEEWASLISTKLLPYIFCELGRKVEKNILFWCFLNAGKEWGNFVNPNQFWVVSGCLSDSS